MVRPGYKQTEVGEIPEDWCVEPLEHFTSFISYGFTNPMPTIADGVYMITARDINNGRLLFESARCTSVEAYKNLLTSKSRPKKNDILLTKDGTLGRLALVGEEIICINQSVAILRPNEKVFPRFFKILLESPNYQSKMLDDAGGSTIKHIYITIVNRMLLGFPNDIEEQKAIAKALSDVDELIVSLEKLIAKKRDIKTATMQQLLTGKKRLPGFGDKWEKKQLGKIANIVSGGTPSTSEESFWNGEILWCTPTDITKLHGQKYLSDTSRKITPQGLKSISSELIPPNSIVMTSRATIGECAINILPVSTNQGFKNFIPAEDTDVEFLYYLLLTMKQTLIGLCAGSTFLEIGKSQLRSIEVFLPTDKQEQSAISSILSDMDSEIGLLEERLKKTKSIKQGMMQELLTGRTRLVDIDTHQIEEERLHGT
ncbi:MAG: restriction endonuclease subunit S [Gammaproteobacteria bacterium]